MFKKTIPLILPLIFSALSRADCKIVDGEKKTPFNGTLTSGLLIEKKALVILNREFPDLNVIEKTFKGELQTCTACTDKYVTCTE